MSRTVRILSPSEEARRRAAELMMVIGFVPRLTCSFNPKTDRASLQRLLELFAGEGFTCTNEPTAPEDPWVPMILRKDGAVVHIEVPRAMAWDLTTECFPIKEDEDDAESDAGRAETAGVA